MKFQIKHSLCEHVALKKIQINYFSSFSNYLLHLTAAKTKTVTSKSEHGYQGCSTSC